MYWHAVESIRKVEPTSDGWIKSLSLIVPTDPPATRVKAIVAGGNWHVGTPFTASTNFMGTTPREALNTLEASELIGGCTVAL
jgi:hypothetical protein